MTASTAQRSWLALKRPVHSAHVTLNGVELLVAHVVSGTHLAQTDIDDACRPTCEVRDVLVGGVSVLGLLSEDQLGEICERIEEAL